MSSNVNASFTARAIGAFDRMVLRPVFHFPRRCYRYCKPLVQSKIGFEIGGPSDMFKRGGLLPVYADATRVDNCNFGHETVWDGPLREGETFRFDDSHAPGNMTISDATDLTRIITSSYDFVLASHVLEHVANPLKALTEWTRVLKEKGLLVLIVPHKDGTFDHHRPVTTLAHLIQDFEQKTTEADLTHLDEILQLHDLTLDPEAGDLNSFKERSKKNLENRCLHHHTFDTRLAVEMVHHMGLQILAVEAFRPANILVLAQKPRAGATVQNDPYRGIGARPVWHSPFPCDRQSRDSGGSSPDRTSRG